MTGCIDQVDDGVSPVQANALELDGYATLPFDVHRVEVLAAHVPWIHGSAEFEHPVGEGRLAVVDMGDD